MSQVNTCLKRILTIFNIIFAIIGALIILLTLLYQILTSIDGNNAMEGRTLSLIILYTFGSITMVIAVLGAYGANRERKSCLIIYLVCMVIGSLMMLRSGIPAAVLRPMLGDVLEAEIREKLPLDRTSEAFQNMIDAVQSMEHCCGIFSYQDWEKNIPKSCECDPDEVVMCKPISLRGFHKTSVYTETCFPYLLHYYQLIADIRIGVDLTLAFLALLGLVLSSLMIHQMRYLNRPTVLMTVPAVFTTPPPPKYQELHNGPAY